MSVHLFDRAVKRFIIRCDTPRAHRSCTTHTHTMSDLCQLQRGRMLSVSHLLVVVLLYFVHLLLVRGLPLRVAQEGHRHGIFSHGAPLLNNSSQRPLCYLLLLRGCEPYNGFSQSEISPTEITDPGVNCITTKSRRWGGVRYITPPSLP